VGFIGDDEAKEFGGDFGIIYHLIQTSKKIGADREFWMRLSEDVETFIHIVELVGKTEATNPYSVYSVPVDYDMSVMAMAGEGSYAEVNGRITHWDTPPGKKRSDRVEALDIHIEKIERTVRPEEVLAELDHRGLRPADLAELLALGAAKPWLQRRIEIIALGTIVGCNGEGITYYPTLSAAQSGRRVSVGWYCPIGSPGWCSDYGFAAVRKDSK
jgi:hypothetical protein